MGLPYNPLKTTKETFFVPRLLPGLGAVAGLRHSTVVLTAQGRLVHFGQASGRAKSRSCEVLVFRTLVVLVLCSVLGILGCIR